MMFRLLDFVGRLLGSEWRSALSVYTRKDIILIGFLGISAGWPLLLTLSVMSYWLATLGVSKTSIGLFALVGVPYNLKFLWAPFIDRVALPYLTRRYGRRRSWAWVSQFALFVSIILLGSTDPDVHLYRAAVLALMVAFFSATQDIVLDALRIELLSKREQGGGAASYVGGYRLALLAVGGGALVLSDYVSWFLVFGILSLGLVIGAVAVAYSREPEIEVNYTSNVGDFFSDAVIAPFRDFLSRPHALLILLFILLYKYGDAFGGIMANPFYLDLGFSGTEIGVITKAWGLVATLVGVFVGGILVARYGIMWALLWGGILQALTNFAFVILAYVGHSTLVLSFAIGSDNLTGGVGTAALVAYISSISKGRYTATQFALLTSFAVAGRTVLSSYSGVIADAISWASFFWLTMLLAVPALLLCYLLKQRTKI